MSSANDLRILFVSAMFRSGSTFMARLLNAHPEIICASDPMRPLFNSMRYDLADAAYRESHARFDPLGDYFLTDGKLLDKILTQDLSAAVQADTVELLSVIARRAEAFSGDYADLIDTRTPIPTYRDCVAYLLDRARDAYARTDRPSYIGFKEVWSNEFFAPIMASFQGAKAIFIVRDPRAIVASNNASGKPYPTIFMGRQWRKLAMLARYFEETTDNAMVVRYEDVVTDPGRVFTQVSSFLGLQSDLGEIDLSTLRDGRDEPWSQNTNYGSSASTGIDPSAAERWRGRVREAEIRAIEFLCEDWMREYGYLLDNNRSELAEFDVGDYPARRCFELADWVQPFSFEEDLSELSKQIYYERQRKSLPTDAQPSEKMLNHLRWWS